MGEKVCDVLDNVFMEPRIARALAKKGNMVDSYRKRYQLLEYDDVMKLSDVMETTVPVDGKGNFPSLEVTPSTLVQMVRDGLSQVGIRVPNVRLNGSAATHVLSGDGKHPYKDLDLIFAVDLSEYGEACTCGEGVSEFNKNSNNNNTYCRTKGLKAAGKKVVSYAQTAARHSPSKGQSVETGSRVQSPSHEQGHELQLAIVADPIDPEISRAKESSGSPESTPCSVSPPTVLEKSVTGDEEDADVEDKDSGYTSSGSSVASLPISPAGSWLYQNSTRSRTHSLDSASSITSSSSIQLGARHKESHTLDVRNGYPRKSYARDHIVHQEPCTRAKDSCWQKIKCAVMSILRNLLPEGVITSNMTDAMLTDAYVQKMVKITNDVDRWSLISLNNNAGRNLELKFVETMRRQYEFSVDSFQIILDSYQRFKIVSRALEKSNTIKLSPNFFPSILAESVYGDFQAALRHLRHRRICTRRPEEIRGGGLLRYCNLLVRDFTPGEVEGHEDDVMDDVITEDTNTEPCHTLVASQTEATAKSYSTSKPEDVRRLEQLMCSRFFIDFSDFTRQQKKLVSYLDSHFANEDDLKFQYLLLVRRVVDKSTVCLMSNERSQIVEFIKKLALDTLAKDVKCNPKTGQVFPPKYSQPQPCFFSYETSSSVPQPSTQYQPPYPYQLQPCHPQMCPQQWTQCCGAGNNPNFYPTPPVPYPDYAPGGNYYPSQSRPTPYYPPTAVEQPLYPACDSYPMPVQKVPIAVCPCCRNTFSQVPNSGEQCGESPTTPQVVVTPPQHKMSVNSPPFYPASRIQKPYPEIRTEPTSPIYLNENATLIYSAGPPPVCSSKNQSEPSETGSSCTASTSNQ